MSNSEIRNRAMGGTGEPNPKSEIRNPKSCHEWVRTEDLEELGRLTRAQVEAARTGDLEGLGALLDVRQRVLDGLRGQRVCPGSLEDVCLRDAEIRALLEARIRSVELTLARLRKGGQALTGYATPVGAPPGFIDQFR